MRAEIGLAPVPGTRDPAMRFIGRTRQLLGGALDLRDEDVGRLGDEVYVLPSPRSTRNSRGASNVSGNCMLQPKLAQAYRRLDYQERAGDRKTILVSNLSSDALRKRGDKVLWDRVIGDRGLAVFVGVSMRQQAPGVSRGAA